MNLIIFKVEHIGNVRHLKQSPSALILTQICSNAITWVKVWLLLLGLGIRCYTIRSATQRLKLQNDLRNSNEKAFPVRSNPIHAFAVRTDFPPIVIRVHTWVFERWLSQQRQGLTLERLCYLSSPIIAMNQPWKRYIVSYFFPSALCLVFSLPLLACCSHYNQTVFATFHMHISNLISDRSSTVLSLSDTIILWCNILNVSISFCVCTRRRINNLSDSNLQRSLPLRRKHHVVYGVPCLRSPVVSTRCHPGRRQEWESELLCTTQLYAYALNRTPETYAYHEHWNNKHNHSNVNWISERIAMNACGFVLHVEVFVGRSSFRI